MTHALLAYIRAQTGNDAPLLPTSWGYTIEDDRWCSIWPLGAAARPEVWFNARLILRHPSFPERAVFVCTRGATSADTITPAQIINHLAQRIADDAIPWTRRWTTISGFVADLSTIAQQIRAAWPDERSVDELGNPIGSRIAHLRRMAGFYDEDGES